MLRLAAALVVASCAAPLAAFAQARAIPPGQEPIILAAVQEAFVDSPAAAIRVDGARIHVETGHGPVLDAVRDPDVRVSLVCEPECDEATAAQWAPVVARLRDSLVARQDALWTTPGGDPGGGPAGASPPFLGLPLPARQAISWVLLALALASLFVAPRGRAPAPRAHGVVALALVLGFVVAALALGPRPLHDHLCFLHRTSCAASLVCDTAHHAWGRPTFHVMALLLQVVPHRLEWILGLSVALTSVVLVLSYDVTARVARRAGLEAWAGEAGLLAAAFAAVHPGFVRLAGTGSFWPITLVVLLGAFHLLLRAGEGEGRRRTAALVGAGAAFALALGGNRMVLTLAPLLILAPYAWPPRRASPLHALAALPVLALLFAGVVDTLGGNNYGAADQIGRIDELALAALRIPTWSALAWSFTTPVVLPVAIVALASRQRLRAMLPLAYAFTAIAATTVFFTGRMEWRQYPDVYLKHFPQLALIAPLFGLGCAAIVRLAAPRVGRGAVLLAPAAALLLVATAWTRPDATRLLFAERVMEREVAALQSAFGALPPHDQLVVAHMRPPPEGLEPSGDVLEMHFPEGLYRAALGARGIEPAPVVSLDRVVSGEVTPERRTLVYVGSTLRTFYASEIEARRVPDSLERPVLARLRQRFDLEPAHAFTVSTEQPRALLDRVAADRRVEIELGFYWLRPRAP